MGAIQRGRVEHGKSGGGIDYGYPVVKQFNSKGETLESLVLNALQKHLMRDDPLKVFCEEYTKHLNTFRSAQNLTIKRHKSEQKKLSKEHDSLIQAIKDGVPGNVVKDDLIRVSEHQEKLKILIDAYNSHQYKPLLHPTMAVR